MIHYYVKLISEFILILNIACIVALCVNIFERFIPPTDVKLYLILIIALSVAWLITYVASMYIKYTFVEEDDIQGI